MPQYTGPGSAEGRVKFALACGVKQINFTVTHDRDSRDDDAWIEIYKDGVLINENRSNVGAAENWWALAGGSSFTIGVNNLQPNACGSIIEVRAYMENSGTGHTYITLSTNNVYC